MNEKAKRLGEEKEMLWGKDGERGSMGKMKKQKKET